jgi:hypothetical protein
MFYGYYMENRSQSLVPQKIVVLAAFLVCALLVGALFSLSSAKANGVQASSQENAGQPGGAAGDPEVGGGQVIAEKTLGSARLDLNALARQDSIDESDNARWSLVRGTPAGEKVYSAGKAVNWKALRKVSASGAYRLPAGSSWSFNATFADGPGYKNASGVLAGGHCALATVFRGAAIQAGLPTKAKPHAWPIPGFPLAQTVNIWWGRDDLVIRNTTGHDLYLAWNLTPDGITTSVTVSQ